MKTFQPDYQYFIDVMNNKRPSRLPLYEHNICPEIMEKILDIKFADLLKGNTADINEFYKNYCRFFKEMTYDVVSCEVCICDILPGGGAILGGMMGPIQNRADFEAYPWDKVTGLYWQVAASRFDALRANMPEGMKAVGGVGNGVFEISEDLVGLEQLPFMQIDDPELYSDVYIKIGDMMVEIWTEFLERYGDMFVACRFGDDLGFKSSLLTNPRTLRNEVFPQYKRLLDLVKSKDIPFLWHSCGCIFEIMDYVIELGICAKHSNEDAIAPFTRWIEEYNSRIAILGGFDLDFICHQTPEEVYAKTVEFGTKFRNMAQGYALGSGNSIPDYVPTENYLAMISGAKKIRDLEEKSGK